MIAMTLARRLLLTAFVVAAGPVAAATWEMPTPYPEEAFHTRNAMQFANDVEAATEAELEIRVRPGGELLAHAKIPGALADGQFFIGEFLLSELSGGEPLLGIDSIPFLAPGYEAAEQLLDAARPALEEALAAQGIQLLYMVPWPPQGLFTTEPVERLEDLQGRRFRSYNPQTQHIAEALGAEGVHIEVPQLRQAFAEGRVEAMITSAATGADVAIWEHASHYYDLQAWLPYNIVGVNQKAFERLDEAARTALLAAAAEAERRGLALSRQEDRRQKAVLAEHGVQILQPTPELRSGLQQIGEQMLEEWVRFTGETGDAVIAAYRQRHLGAAEAQTLRLMTGPHGGAERIFEKKGAQLTGAYLSLAASAVRPFSVHTTSPVLSPARIETQPGAAIGGALGYRYGGIRLEGELEYGRFDADSIRFAEGGGALSGHFDRWGATLNAFYDLPTGTRLQPYLGAGAGMVRFRAREVTLSGFPPTVGSNTLLAYQLMSGITYVVTDSWGLDFGYRFMEIGEQDYETGGVSLRGEPIRTHAVRLGARYFF